MVVHKVVELKISHILEIFYSMCDLEIVVIVMPAVECFMQGIVCYTVESFSIYPSAVITMDHFAHKPEIFFYFCCCAAESTHEVKIKDICRIQTDSIYIKF